MESENYARDVHRVGNGLFGRGIRLKLALWVRDQKSPFFQSQAGREVDIPVQYLRAELARLAELGLVAQLPSDPGDRRLFYEVVSDNPLWEVFDAARRALGRMRTKGSGHPSPRARAQIEKGRPS
ncbi:MAG: hypothetical protein WBA31_08585 [Candidatus Dormiibacterota bacterium]